MNKKLEELKAKYKALQAKIEDEYPCSTPPAELQAELQSVIQEYQTAKAEAEKEEAKKNNNKGVVDTMNKKQICNKVIKALLMKKSADADLVAQSGVVGIVDQVGSVGSVEAVGSRGGYLIPEDQLELDKYGNEIVTIPARRIPVTLPKGKIPNVDLSQAKDGKFLAKHDELDTIGKNNPVFGQVDYDCEAYTGIVPVSMDLMEDTDDIMPVISECFVVTSKAQENSEVLATLNGIANPKTQAIGSGKSMKDKEAIVAIRKAILGKLSGVNRAKAKIVVCDSDFALLACIEDNNGKPYICQDVTNPSIYRLEGHEVIAIDDIFMTVKGGEGQADTVGGYAWVGNFERVAIVERKGLEVSSDTSNMFEIDALAVKGKKRIDVILLEKNAFVKVS